MKTKLRNLATILILAVSAFVSSQNIFAQTQRNPVLEFCTGTWCQWCPCGDQIVENSILPNIPNAIVLAYHGPLNYGDPFANFPGYSIISSLGLSSYPTGVIDRVSGIVSRGSWYSLMNNRNNTSATVSIDIDKSYNVNTREFNASIDFTALQNLNGQYSFNVILVEDGQVWGQTSNNTCTPGITYISDYIHYWLVRDMINGAAGEEIVNGTWNQGQTISKTVSHTLAIPPSPAPDFIPDSSAVVVIVYKNGTPLNVNAEIQQAEKLPLVSPNYVAIISSQSPDVIISNDGNAEFSAKLYNVGLMSDIYNVTATIAGPLGWTGDFTTDNGTFPLGEIDSVQVAVDDSTIISVQVNPNFFNGSGIITLECASQNDPGNVVNVTFSVVTNEGVHLLVVDATEDDYASLVSNTLDSFYEGRYGVVSREALSTAGLDLSYFTMIAWSAGNSTPAFYPEEVNNLQAYLDQGGNLLLSGQNIGTDIFDPAGQSQFAQSFFNNYLHANYVANAGVGFLLSGYAGDPITDNLIVVANSLYARSLDEISAFDASATPIMQFGSGPTINSIRADNGSHKVVYFGFAFEQINDVSVVDSLVKRSVNWLTDGIVLDNDDDEPIVKAYSLEQNYPNPFNPSTSITYSIPQESDVSLKVYDIMGREVTELVSSRQATGTYNVEFDASSLASGTYIYKLTAGDFISVKKMILLK